MEVEYYEKPDGSCPVEEFILNQDKKMQAKILRMITLLERFGNNLRESYSKHLSDGIFELRAQVGNNATRTLYFFLGQDKAILTNGFVKKTQRTPLKEILTAKKRRQDHQRKNRSA